MARFLLGVRLQLAARALLLACALELSRAPAFCWPRAPSSSNPAPAMAPGRMWVLCRVHPMEFSAASRPSFLLSHGGRCPWWLSSLLTPSPCSRHRISLVVRRCSMAGVPSSSSYRCLLRLLGSTHGRSSLPAELAHGCIFFPSLHLSQALAAAVPSPVLCSPELLPLPARASASMPCSLRAVAAQLPLPGCYQVPALAMAIPPAVASSVFIPCAVPYFRGRCALASARHRACLSQTRVAALPGYSLCSVSIFRAKLSVRRHRSVARQADCVSCVAHLSSSPTCCSSSHYVRQYRRSTISSFIVSSVNIFA
jgi:hypothetical protein